MGWKRRMQCGMLWASCLLAGCGNHAVSPVSPITPVSPTVPVVADLNGSWLITGDLPSFVGISKEPMSQVNFAATLFVNGHVLTGAGGYTANGCGLPGAQNIPIAGTVGDDGHFSAEMGPFGGVALHFSGVAPAAEGGAWKGTYTFSNPGCQQPTMTGVFTSQALGAVTGTYTGAALLGPADAIEPGHPVAITLELQQGDVPADNGSYYGMTGTIAVDGSPCFHSGTVASAIPSGVEGNGLDVNFVMDDGSVFHLFGQFTDTAAKTLSITNGRALGGSCSDVVVGPFTLSR